VVGEKEEVLTILKHNPQMNMLFSSEASYSKNHLETHGIMCVFPR
jgi:hypothetical protein